MNAYKDMLTEAGGMDFNEAAETQLTPDDIDKSLVGI